MMVNVDALKNRLINELWLPIVIEGSAIFYPRLRKNKKMKLLSLTNDRNFSEIVKFEENKLIQGSDAIAWVSTLNKRWRLESELVCSVLDGDIHSALLLDSSCQLYNNFPLDVINFDFSSQDSYLGANRIEKEIETVEKVINLQNQKMCPKFILVYTTILDSNNIDKNNVVQTSDSIRISGWLGLNVNNFPQVISDENMKKVFMEEVTKKICQKYGYSNFKSNNSLFTISGCNDKLYSIVGIFVR